MLMLFCGIAGSGKSTEAQKMKKDDPSWVYLSSDALRAVVGKDESDMDPKVNYIVFRTLEQMTEYFLKQGENVIVDTTNRSIRARAPFIKIARELGQRVEATVMETPLELALLRNSQRARKVPEKVIEEMAKDFLPPVEGEVDYVYYVKST